MNWLKAIDLNKAERITLTFNDGWVETIEAGGTIHCDGEAIYIFNAKTMKIINLDWVKSIVVEFKEKEER